jgi:hypothetical protein
MLNVEGTAGQRKHSHAAALLAVVTAMHHASEGRGGDFATMPNGPQSTTTNKHVEADHDERESGGGEKEWEDPEESESQQSPYAQQYQ